ncbi:josephin-like protein [Humulus lupulus]|uniref:josephin-like protein n=1 Tax=Humulus lupulus TaxID=3486 RepID=UPI002B40B7C2|nr:josephin-like protein [Humulus lupulus]
MLSRTNSHEPSRDYTEEKSFLYHKQNSGRRSSVGGGSKRFGIGCGCTSNGFQLPKGKSSFLSPIRLLKHFAGEFARVLCMVSGTRRKSSSSSSSTSRKNSSSARSKPFVAPLDSHRMEAIEDCIQFINSSCTLSRSNSTAN